MKVEYAWDVFTTCRTSGGRSILSGEKWNVMNHTIMAHHCGPSLPQGIGAYTQTKGYLKREMGRATERKSNLWVLSAEVTMIVNSDIYKVWGGGCFRASLDLCISEHTTMNSGLFSDQGWRVVLKVNMPCLPGRYDANMHHIQSSAKQQNCISGPTLPVW